VGTGSGDAKLEKEFRLLHRYLTTARNRGDRLERRLDQLKKDRKRLAYRLQRDAEREARRLKAASVKAMSTFERESPVNAPYPPAAYSNPPKCPVNAVSESDSDLWEYRDDAINSRRLAVQSTTDIAQGELTQTISNTKDSEQLRNEFRASAAAPPEPVAGTVPVAIGRGASSSGDSRDESGFTWLDASAPLASRVKMMRYRDWSNPAAIPGDEAEILRRLAAMPDSPDRDLAARLTFGSAKTMRRCLRAFLTWGSSGAGSRVEASRT